jgi:type I restriction enzyme S subunit
MRDGWVETTLDKVTECSWGNTETTKSKYVESGFLAYSASGADGFLDWFEHDRTAVVLSAIGAQCGKTWFAEGKWTSIKNTIWLKSDNLNLLDKYLFYLSNRDQFWQIRGQAQPFISLGDVKKTKVLLPPLPEQKRIVDLISSVDFYIAALQQQLESAKKSRNAVLHELLSKGGDDWVEMKLPEIVEVLDRMRKPVNSTEREMRRGNIPYYGANGQTGWIDKSLFNEELVLLGEDAIDFADPSARKAYLIQGPSWVNNHAHVLRANKSIVDSYFLMESLNKVDYSKFVSFGTRSKLTQASMNGIKLLIPPLRVQESFVDLVSSFDEVINFTQTLIEETKSSRTGMLSQLLSGKHEIPTSYDEVMDFA